MWWLPWILAWWLLRGTNKDLLIIYFYMIYGIFIFGVIYFLCAQNEKIGFSFSLNCASSASVVAGRQSFLYFQKSTLYYFAYQPWPRFLLNSQWLKNDSEKRRTIRQFPSLTYTLQEKYISPGWYYSNFYKRMNNNYMQPIFNIQTLFVVFRQAYDHVWL